MRKIRIALAALLLIPLAALGQPEWVESGEIPAEPGRDYTSPGGHTFYLEIFEDRFYAVFFDEERQPIEPPVPWIVLRGHPHEFPKDTFNLQLSPNSKGVYTAARVFPPRHEYWMAVVIPQNIEKDEYDVVPPGRFVQD